MRDPDDFTGNSFRRINREADGKPISLIIGKIKGESKTTVQSFRYPKNAWSKDKAEAHCKRNDGITFEPATGEEAMKQILDMEKRLREADLKSLQDYKKGKAEAPTLYKPLGYVKAMAEGAPMTFVANEESEDRTGDIITVLGWDLKQFETNPVLMFAHDYTMAPIGTVPKVWVEGKQLLNLVKFDMEDPLGAFIKGKYERGIMRAESVGFRALEWEELSTGGVKFLKQELLEISAVPVPAHPAALRKMMDNRKFFIAMPEVVKVEPEPITETIKADMQGMGQAMATMREHMAGMLATMDEMEGMMGEEEPTEEGATGISADDAETIKKAIRKIKGG